MVLSVLCKYTLRPVSPPLSVNRSLMCCSFCIVMGFFKFIKFSPNVCMLVVLVIKFGRIKVVACNNKFKVNISVSNNTQPSSLEWSGA